MTSAAEAEQQLVPLGPRVRTLRQRGGATVRQLGERAGMSASAISKIENGQLSPTYETLVKLARGLEVDISALFTDSRSEPPPGIVAGRRSITRDGQGDMVAAQNYRLEMLCTDLLSKKMVPMKGTLQAHEIRSFGPLVRHDGEELILVLRGEVELRTEFYAPTVLQPGDCAYFDSTMGHALLVAGPEEAEVFWVSTTDTDFARLGDGFPAGETA